MQLEIQNNNQENSNIKQELEKYISDKKQFKSQIGISDLDNKDKNNIDSNILSNVLNNLSDMGYDIFKGANLSEEEIKLVGNMLNKNNISNKNENSKKNEKINDSMEGKDENKNNLEKNMNINGEENEEIEKKNENENEGEEYEYENDEEMKDDLELGNQVVSLIEKDVNDLYIKKVIEQIKIDQINAITYTFENEKDEAHEITLKIVNDELYCIDGTKFSDWLIENFSS